MVSFSEPGLTPYENTLQGIMGNITGMVKMPLATAGTSMTEKMMERTENTKDEGGGDNHHKKKSPAYAGLFIERSYCLPLTS